LNAISAVAAVRLYTELLKPEQVGRLSLLLASIALFNLFLVAPVGSYVMRKAIEWHAEGTLIEQLKRPLIYSFLSSAFAMVVSIGLIRTGLLATSMLVAPLMGFAVLGTGLSSFGSQLFNYLGRPFKYVALSVFYSWAGVAISAVLCLRITATAEGWVIGSTLAQVSAGLASIILVKTNLGPGEQSVKPTPGAKTSGFDLWAVLLFSAPMLVATCLFWVQTDGYRYFFAHMVDERTLGLFAAGLAVGISPMLLLERMINDTYLPLLTRAIALNGRKDWPLSWDNYASASILPLVLLTMLVSSGAPFFARLLVSHTYYAVAWLGALGALAKCLQMMCSLYVGFSYAALETSHLIGPFFVGAVVTIGCIFLLTPIPPLLGFGISLVSGSASALAAIAWAAKRRYNLRFPYFAIARAVALGLPIVGVNLAFRFLVAAPGVPGCIALLGGDTLYIAGLCWFLHPKDSVSNALPNQAAVFVSREQAQV